MEILSKITYYAFVLLVIVLGVGLIGTQTSLLGNYELKIVQSGSMEPTIPTGSLVIVAPVEQYQVNDVVTFGSGRVSEVPTTHRIVGDQIQNGELRYITKGDANEERDAGFLDPNKIIGKVVLSIPFLGYLIDFARQPIGFILLIALPALMVIGDEIWVIYRELRKKPSEKEEKNSIEKHE